jgi:hypothetical protein
MQAMHRALLHDHLVMAEQSVAQGERHIAAQRARIAEAERAGLDTSCSRALLQTFEEIQALHLASLRRMRATLWSPD